MNPYADLIDHGQDIHALDAGYLRPGLAAVHIIVQSGRVAFVDTGTQHSVPAILRGLRALGLDAETDELILLTYATMGSRDKGVRSWLRLGDAA